MVCPINPFEWPVKASVAKYALRTMTGAYKDSHYRTVYFHNSGPAADRAYKHYWNSIADAVAAFRKRRDVFVILVATERLDARPANKIAEKLGGVPVLTSDQYNMYELVSILRACIRLSKASFTVSSGSASAALMAVESRTPRDTRPASVASSW